MSGLLKYESSIIVTFVSDFIAEAYTNVDPSEYILISPSFMSKVATMSALTPVTFHSQLVYYFFC